MSAQHTPGPWSVGRCSWNEERNVCYELEGIKQGCAADARLIAAAPDLLEALERLSAQCDRMRMPGQPMSDAEKNARAAIAKATGQKDGA